MALGCAASVLANALTFITLTLGSICTLFPTNVIDYLLSNNDHQSTDDAIANTLCKLLGALLVAYSSAFLLHSIKARLVSQAILGLSILLIGLLDSDSIEIYTIVFVGIGSVVVLIACVGLMCIFYPMSSTVQEQEEDSRPENIVPLLEDASVTDEADRTDEVEEGIHPDESRITGTKRLLKLAGPHTFYLYAGCIVLLIRLPFSLSIPHFVSETLGALARTDYGKAKTSIFLLFALGTVDAALDFWCVFLFGKCNLNITRGVRIDTFAAILKQDIGFHDMTGSGDLASRLNSDAGEMGYDLTWFFRFSIESVVRIVSIVTYMMWRSPSLGACAVSVVPFVAAINKRYGDWLNKNAKEVQNALAQANSVAQEAFSCIRTVIAFASEDEENKKYQEKINHHYDLNVEQLYKQGLYYMIISTFLINTVVQALLLYVGMYLIRNDRLSPEVLLAFMLYQSKLQNEVMNLFNSYTSLIKSSGAGDKVFEILDRQIPEPGTGNENVNCGDNIGISQVDITFENVSFTYPSRPNQQILKRLDLKVPAGKTVAIIGKSGSGKSTIVGLLQRFYDPSTGSIFINEKRLKEINLKSHRKRIGVVTQDPVLFTGTIKENIMYGSENITEEDIVNAAKLSNAHNFITEFPDGYNTQVGERGCKLSGGQRQRISIARAVISKPTLLLLDEATSALDNESESLVQEALDKLLNSDNQMTTIVIAHRLQTVRNADKIVVLDKGTIAEEGSHDELHKLGGLYSDMVQKANNGSFSED